MTSFADRFKDKAQIVGKTGEGAMLVQNVPPPPPKMGAASSSSPSSSAQPLSSRGTPPLSGNRAHHSLLPAVSGAAPQPKVSSTSGFRSNSGRVNGNNGNGAFRDHIRQMAACNSGGGDSSAVQMSHGAQQQDRTSTGGSSGRTHSHSHGRPNPLAEQPLDRMTFIKGKYRGKDEFDPDLRFEVDKCPPPQQRPLNYKPYTVEDWRQKKDQLAVVKGGVGRPPSDTDEQRLYRALRNRTKEFSAETEAINRVALMPENLPRPPKPLTPPKSDELIEKAQRRQKAVEFAKNVPKPRVVKPSDTLNNNNDTIRDGGDGDEDEGDFDGKGAERRQKEIELANLEEQHRRDQEALAAMKKRFAM